MIFQSPTHNSGNLRDHGGDLVSAMGRFGGMPDDWLDLSTGINPVPYPCPNVSARAWTALPTKDAAQALCHAARGFWQVPNEAAVLAVPGASAAIAAIPRLLKPDEIDIPGPTYNEHEAAFRAAGWQIRTGAACRVMVHPNNPDGRLWDQSAPSTAPLTVIDESFCDVAPQHSMIDRAVRPGCLVLKSFGKFWGLAGLRLGFVIGDPHLIAALADQLGPWPVSGPALEIGRMALNDNAWAAETRKRLANDAGRLDQLMTSKGARAIGGTTLFRLFEVDHAVKWQDQLAQAHIWSRIFPYSDGWLRLGLAGTSDDWARLETAL